MKRTKGASIVRIVLLSVVILLLLGIMVMGIAGKGYSIFKNNIDTPMQSESFEFDISEIKSIEIDSDYGNIKLCESDTNKIIVEGVSSSEFELTAEKNGKTLEIEQDSRVYSVFLGRIPKFETIIYLPKDFSGTIDIESDFGNITSDAELKGKFIFHTDCGNIELKSVAGKFDLSTDMGNIELDSAEILSSSSAQTDLGNIEIAKTNPVNITASTDLGSTNIYGSDSSSSVSLHAQTDMGNIKINNK